MCHMLSGAIILDESAMYNDVELLMLFSFSLLCIAGIYIIAKKPQFPCYKDRPVHCTSRKTKYEVEQSNPEIENYKPDSQPEEEIKQEREPDQIIENPNHQRLSQVPDSEREDKSEINDTNG